MPDSAELRPANVRMSRAADMRSISARPDLHGDQSLAGEVLMPAGWRIVCLASFKVEVTSGF